jgi:hypothetical protein
MTRLARAARGCAVLICGFLLATDGWSKTTELSGGILVYPPNFESWAVYAYNPHTTRWIKLDNVSWKAVSSLAHSGYVIEATAPSATTASTYRVVMEVTGRSVEVFMTPSITQRLVAGETATLRINLF